MGMGKIFVRRALVDRSSNYLGAFAPCDLGRAVTWTAGRGDHRIGRNGGCARRSAQLGVSFGEDERGRNGDDREGDGELGLGFVGVGRSG